MALVGKQVAVWHNVCMEQAGLYKDEGLDARLRLRHPLVLIWPGLVLLGALLLPHRVWNTLLIGFGGLFFVAFVWARSLARGLYASRKLRYGWVAVGDQLEEWFALRNDSLLPALWVEVRDESNVPGYQAAVVRSVGGKDFDRWRETAVCQQRGQFTLGPWTIQTGDPFGLFIVTRQYPISNEIIIHPPIIHQIPVPLPLGHSSGRTPIQQRHPQATTNVASVRDHRPGDPWHWIHWRTTARRDDLYVRLFEQDTAGDIWLILDLQADVQLGSGPTSTEEYGVLLAASLAARGLRQNRAVGLATYGQLPQFLPPARGQGQRWRVLRALALVRADGTLSLAAGLRDLVRVAHRGTTAVIITPTPHTDWLPGLAELTRHGIRSSVILFDRASFGGPENSHALQQIIRQLGYACHLIHREEIPRPDINGERWQFRVTATGKVITIRQPAAPHQTANETNAW
ncbi:MAG: DUF58 domain-containing protein [Chloroflexi bacterium]|nr:MAG: DUF58 domain-containing protein [Chloroflexota bacterium]